MEKKKFQELYQLWLQGRMTDKEWTLFRDSVIDTQNSPTLDRLIETDLTTNEFDAILSAEELQYAYQMVLDQVQEKPLKARVNHFFTLAGKWQAAVAAIVFVLSIGLWVYNSLPRREKSETSRGLYAANDIAPGGNKATLTLADGKTITLSDAKSGVVIDARKLTYNDGSLLQEGLESGVSNALMEIHTPKGGQYKLTLPDGSKIWLNAASSLKFPKTFSDQSNRIVELSGEAYFEVSKDKKHPFRVRSTGQEVEVLGTHFNINSYADEGAVKTTLLEGSVKVNEMILKPNQQSALDNGKITVQDVNAAQAIAWKNGLFVFENASLETVMRQISRWYDIEVEYTGKSSERIFNGKVYKNMSLTKVLEVLSLSKVNYKIEGKKIIVIK